MAKADAWLAAGGRIFSKRKSTRESSLAGNARIIAEPAYKRLLAAEPVLRRSIPALIVIFLTVVAAARFMSLMAWHDDVERNAKAVLGLASGELVNALMLAKADGDPLPRIHQELLERTGQHGAMGNRYILAVTDKTFTVQAATPKVADQVMDGVSQARDAGGLLGSDVKRVIEALEVKRDGDRLRFTLKVSNKQLEAVFEKLGPMMGGSMGRANRRPQLELE